MTINIKQALFEYKRKSFFSIFDAINLGLKNRHLLYTWVERKEWQQYKTSDTIFVFGSGPSINDITDEQWGFIKANDSLGLNFAFLTQVPMTYYYLGYEPASKESILKAFSQEIRSIYSDTLWFLPTKSLYRLVHPRLIPEFFPPEPKVAIFELPSVIQFKTDRPFNDKDFQKSLAYRGVMGVGLNLIYQLGYKRIVLLGVDLDTHKHFFDDYHVMKHRRWYNEMMAPGKVFEAMIPKGQKYRTMEEYYYALNELYFKPNGINLYVGNKTNLLTPRIPTFPDFN